jgi:Protein of unknown function (DUF3568)
VSWRKRLARWRPILLLPAVLLLLNAGCLAVAAGAATYGYFKGKVCQEYAATFADTWKAVETGLKELGFPIDNREQSGITGQVLSRTGDDNTTITIDLTTLPSRIPAEGSVTRVCVRVGTFGDQMLSKRILAQIGGHLVPVGLVPRSNGSCPPPVPATAGPITPASWTKPAETSPPAELPVKPVPVGK